MLNKKYTSGTTPYLMYMTKKRKMKNPISKYYLFNWNSKQERKEYS